MKFSSFLRLGLATLVFAFLAGCAGLQGWGGASSHGAKPVGAAGAQLDIPLGK